MSPAYPHISHPNALHLFYPFLCGRHLNATNQTGSLRRSCHKPCHLPRYASSICDSIDSLSHLLRLFSSVFSVTIHPELVRLSICPLAVCRRLRYNSTSSPCDIAQWSDRTVVFRCDRGSIPAGGFRSPEIREGRVAFQEFPTISTTISADRTLSLSSPF